MEYKVLYRKYRPNNFDDIIDQDYIITILKNSLKSKKTSHAYLFSGPRGTGKTTTAKVFAKAVNCQNLKDSGPCNECENCKNFNNNPDIIELDAASNNGVDEIREIIDNVKVAPTYSKFKIYIIDEVHMLTTNAFNALLLTLEEPPANVIFILATTNVESVPVTILSRCQRFDFKRISVKALVERLKYVCQKENINAEENALEEIAKLSDGGMRDALSILDQVQQENNVVNMECIEKIYGIVPVYLIENLISFFKNDNINEIVDLVNQFKQMGINYKSLIKQLIEKLKKEAIDYLENKDYDNFTKFKNCVIELNETLNHVNVYIDPYTIFEMTILGLCNSNFTSVNNKALEIADAKKELKKAIDTGSKQNYFPGNNFEDKELDRIKKIRINNCFVNPKKSVLENIKQEWVQFSNINQNSQVLSLLVDVVPVAASDEVIIVSTTSKGTCELFNLNLTKLENELLKERNLNQKLIALTDSEWKKSRSEYATNLKNGFKYEYIKEDEAKKTSSTKEKKDTESSNIEKLAQEIFDNDKIIIEKENE